MDFTKDLVFTARAQSLSDDATTVALYQILLGRDPENSFVIEEAKTQRIAQLIKSFLSSKEFADYVLAPIREGLRLRHELMSPSPTPTQRAWMGSLLVLTTNQENALSQASTWRDFFCAFIPSAIVTNLFRDGSVSGTIGRIEHCGPGGVRGWALRLPITDQSAEIECFVGEHRVGRTICSENRPDLNDLLGCNNCAGFTLAFEKDALIESFQGLELRLVDAQTSALVCRPVVFELGRAQISAVASRLRAKVATIEWQFAELKSMLDYVDSRS